MYIYILYQGLHACSRVPSLNLISNVMSIMSPRAIPSPEAKTDSKSGW